MGLSECDLFFGRVWGVGGCGWVSVTFFGWVWVGECDLFWLGVGECMVYNCPINIHGVAKHSCTSNAKGKLKKILNVYKENISAACNVSDI